MSHYQAVFLDAGDTLIDFYSTGDRVTRLVGERTGRRVPPAEARPYFDAAFHYALGGAGNGLLWVNDVETERQYWANYYAGWLDAAGLDPHPALVEELVADTLNLEIYTAFADAPPALETLGAAGIKRVLISNAFPSMQHIMRRLDLERHFDECLYSCHVGYEKPGAEIFNLALSLVDLPPAATCFVDDVPRNVEAATSLGIHGLLIDRWERHPHSPWPKLTSLAELQTHLGL